MIEIKDTLFVVMSSEDDSPEPTGKIVIRMPPLPPRVQGAGWHKDTSNCLAALVRVWRQRMSVLDLGAGSGIIAVAAAKLGADQVYATEHHPHKREFMKRVFELNGVTVDVAESHEDLPHVDICVANVGAEYVREIQDSIHANLIITAENQTGEVLIYA